MNNCGVRLAADGWFYYGFRGCVRLCPDKGNRDFDETGKCAELARKRNGKIAEMR